MNLTNPQNKKLVISSKITSNITKYGVLCIHMITYMHICEGCLTFDILKSKKNQKGLLNPAIIRLVVTTPNYYNLTEI